MAVLNSSIMQYYYEKRYRSVKVLRTQLEELPIPIPTEDKQKEIVALVDQILALEPEGPEAVYQQLCQEIDRQIMRLYEK